ncbi:transcriptional regulator [Ferroplasma acidarmanus]|jgi:predicted transcriptional regulator|uniref:Ribosomal protein n=1 Tax=Ferroplasma acidarmanus Fer1 TaxID=333146 RepID=S0AQ35_FERAC|nr:transcriptional regulator [Ferroplasma acidarmanus]AGO61051.1 ribosomal protein [Ferroplasma acidarmanus Fer1]
MNDYSIFKEIRENIETLERHMTIIKTLLMEQPLGIIKMSQQTGIPEHKIRYSLRILEHEGIIEASREGAILTSDFLGNKDQILKAARESSEGIEKIYRELKNILESS